MTILRDLVVAVGKWTANDGTEKTRWRTIGQMHEGSKGKYLTLDPTFNLAAVPLKEGDYRVYVNLFAPKDRSAPSQKTPEDRPAPSQKTSGDLDPNDDIPF